MIGVPNELTTSGQSSNTFVTSSSTNNNTATLQTVISALLIRKNILRGYCGSIVNKYDACIIRGPKLIPTTIGVNINQFNTLCGDEPTDPPREGNIQYIAAHFQYRTSLTKTNPLVSAIMGRLNRHAIDNVLDTVEVL